MRVLVVGIKHQLQPARFLSIGYEASQLEDGQKQQYARMLLRLIDERGVQFVGEEAKHGIETVTQRIARIRKCRCANIEMPPSERQARDIPPGYADEGSRHSPEDIARWHQEREQHMFEKTIELVAGPESVLILCGRDHTQALAHLFQQAGHAVETYDVNMESWYIDDWMKNLLGS